MEKIYTLPLGALAANCYIIPAEGAKAVVIDPASAAQVEMFLKSRDLSLGGIIITHGHFDHFAGVAQLLRDNNAEVWAPLADAQMLQSAQKSWAEMMPVPFEPVTANHTFKDGDSFSVCGVEFNVMTCSGHTAGSCLLFCPTLGSVAFTGDVIFAGAVGRTDGYSGSTAQMRQSLSKISRLEGDCTFYCGHGQYTTLSAEKMYNPYLS